MQGCWNEILYYINKVLQIAIQKTEAEGVKRSKSSDERDRERVGDLRAADIIVVP